MKSLKFSETLTCPNGCEAFEADRWSFINVTQNPELKDAVLGGELNLFCCPQCSTFFHVDTDLIYLDEENGLLIFVFSDKNRRSRKALLEKMKKDYELLKDNLLKRLKLDVGPFCVFGLEELKDAVQKEQRRADESEAVAASAAALGLKVARLHPQWAREHDTPLYIPAETDRDAKSFASAAQKVLDGGLQSPLLEHFVRLMEKEDALAPDLL